MDDGILLRRWVRQGDSVAFNELVRRYAGMVYATSRRILGDATEAEDVAQECFLRLAVDRPSVRRSVAGWLHSAAASRSLNRLRSEHRRLERERRYSEALEPGDGVDEELRASVDLAVAELPERLREAVLRHFMLGETHEAIARELGLSRSAVTRRIERGVAKVRESLRRRGYPVLPVLFADVLSGLRSADVPASLQAALGRAALGGPGALAGASAQGASSVFAATASWKVAGMLLVLLFAVASWRVWTSGSAVTVATPEAHAGRTASLPLPAPPRLQPAKASEPAPPAATADAPSPKLLWGMVVDTHGMPVPGATLFPKKGEILEGFLFQVSMSYEGVSFRTGADGRFTIPDAPADAMLLAASHPQYVVQEVPINPVGPTRIVLEPGVIVEGRVTVEDGDPSNTIAVYANLARANSDVRGRVEPDGRYRIESLRPGYLNIIAELRADDGRRLRSMGRELTATGGKRLNVDLRFAAATASVSGVVTFNGAPLVAAGTHIIVEGENGTRESHYWPTDEAGFYSHSSVVPGPARMRIDCGNIGQSRRFATVPLSLRPGKNWVDVALGGSAALRVYVDAPAEEAFVVEVIEGDRSLKDWTFENLNLLREESTAGEMVVGGGEFLFEALDAGPHTVIARLLGDGGEDLAKEGGMADVKYDAVSVTLEEGKEVSVSLNPH